MDSYQHWMSDPDQAVLYSEAQHAGSLGPGRTLARLIDLSGCHNLLDIGGGTGAMTIRLLETFPIWSRRLSTSPMLRRSAGVS